MIWKKHYNIALNNILSDPWLSSKQFALLIIAWIHAVIGLHFFLRLFETYRRLAIHLYPVIIISPLLVIFSLGRVGLELDVARALAADAANQTEFHSK